MEILKGIPVSPGVYIGEAFLLESEDVRIPDRFILSELVEEELRRFARACNDVGEELQGIVTKTMDRLGENLSGILAVQLQILKDENFRKEVAKKIQNDRYSAERAVARTLQAKAKRLRDSGDEYLAQRESDINDLERRLLRNLLGRRREDLAHLERPVALVARDLAPSQTAALDRTRVKALATDVGGRTSHTAILARAYEIPAVVGLETVTTDITGGEAIIVDGNRGIVILRPDERTLVRYRKRLAEYQDFEAEVRRDKDLPAVTSDNREIHVLANIEFPEEAAGAMDYGAFGIGLFRTEFLYLRGGVMPNERDHFDAYRRCLAKLNGRLLVIRTFDLGADKAFPGESPPEHNPALGLRSIRVSMRNPALFRAQVRAALRASALGRVRLMLPMVTTVEELRWAKRIVKEIQADLARAREQFDPKMPVGVMIEVPAAALNADVLAREAEFFSIGTNDLTQYTLAVDRGNEHVADLYSPANPAVLKLIRLTVKAAEKADISLSLCGEMAGDPLFVPLLIGLGLTELSVAPPLIPDVKRIIRAESYERCRRLADEVMQLEDAEEATEALREHLAGILPTDTRFQGV
jgi:phosphotransferase system enzyme I (PtsI)